MITSCPGCHKKLRIDATRYAGRKNLAIKCRNCGQRFPLNVPASGRILVAHGEEEVCHSIQDVCRQDLGEIHICHDARTARRMLGVQDFSVLLLDVALPGAFPFQLIDEIRASMATTKVILLPSVYNRTAYKRKPSSLYGADAYLELHHLSDRLIPLMQELQPQLKLVSRPYCNIDESGEERSLPQDAGPEQQALELARLLVADIALYHQEQIDQGITCGDLEKRLTPQLEEGRRLLASRIPAVNLDKQDYLLSALADFAAARRSELQAGEAGPHD